MFQRVTLASIVLTALIGLLCASKIYAQTPASEPLNITTSPDVFDISANPGDTIKKTFRVRNNNTTLTTLKITLQKIIPDKNGNLILQDFKPQDDYAHWLTVSTATVSASPREWIDIPFTITLPKEAAFGYYWALLISNEPGQIQNGATAHISGAVAIPVLLTVQKEGLIFNARLTNETTTHGVYEYLPATFLTTIQNMSNVHIRPTGTIFITDFLGQEVAKLSFNKDAGSILPNGKRTYETAWDDSFITYDPKMEDGKILVDSKGKKEMQLHFHFDKVLSLRMGKYTATVLIVVSGDKKDISFQQTTTFFVFPWKIILGALIFFLLAGVGLWNISYSLVKKIKGIFKHE